MIRGTVNKLFLLNRAVSVFLISPLNDAVNVSHLEEKLIIQPQSQSGDLTHAVLVIPQQVLTFYGNKRV